MKRKIHKTTLLVIAIILIIAVAGIVVLTNTDRIAVQLAPKKQGAFNAEHRNEINVPFVLVGGDQSFASLLPKMAEGMRARGCKNVVVETIKDARHYVAEDRPEIVAELIERYASL